MRIAYLECFAGISGDMLLGALVDAGVPFERLEEAVSALDVGARLARRKVLRGGLTGTKVDVLVGDEPADGGHTHEHSHEDGHAHSHEHVHEHDHAEQDHAEHGHDVNAHKHVHTHAPHRHLSSILKIIRAAELTDTVKERACRAFQLLGEAEASIHGIDVEKVHFHEVGAVDTIVDIVCTAVGAELLGVNKWISSPLNVGSGTVKCQHGTLPVPAPATLALLADAPVYASGSPMERVTPTGASVLRMLDVRYEAMPAMRVKACGYGAGGRDTPNEPNLLRLMVGETAEKLATDEGEPIAVITTVIDDSNPQVLAYVSEVLLEAGAWDVYRVAVQMKKGRTGVEMTVLCRPDLLQALQDILFRETTTIGLHWRLENKRSLQREFATVATPWGTVKIKIARWNEGAVVNASPEYEDCKALAAKHGVPLKEVMRAAIETWTAKTKESK
ncbi:MAG: nickel pincer cofactor biosynthesis protein LarC [Terracidiphilus sp.]|nr:nickel pincer cofactor biosynthesis protein LarC [Terracidiphilus sp.]